MAAWPDRPSLPSLPPGLSLHVDVPEELDGRLDQALDVVAVGDGHEEGAGVAVRDGVDGLGLDLEKIQ